MLLKNEQNNYCGRCGVGIYRTFLFQFTDKSNRIERWPPPPQPTTMYDNSEFQLNNLFNGQRVAEGTVDAAIRIHGRGWGKCKKKTI